jgi:hypothetical protein
VAEAAAGLSDDAVWETMVVVTFSCDVLVVVALVGVVLSAWSDMPQSKIGGGRVVGHLFELWICCSEVKGCVRNSIHLMIAQGVSEERGC